MAADQHSTSRRAVIGALAATPIVVTAAPGTSQAINMFVSKITIILTAALIHPERD
jgi:hypothetical protein